MQELREELRTELWEEVRKDIPELVASAVQAELARLQPTAPPLPTQARHPTTHDMLSDSGNTVVQESSPLPDFDAARYRLGRLCPKGHEYQGTGKSLRRQRQGDCAACGKLAKRQKRQLAKARQAGRS